MPELQQDHQAKCMNKHDTEDDVRACVINATTPTIPRVSRSLQSTPVNHGTDLGQMRPVHVATNPHGNTEQAELSRCRIMSRHLRQR